MAPLPPLIAGERVTLRPVEEADIQARAAAGRHPEFLAGLGGDPASAGPMNIADATVWFERSRDAGAFAIEFEGRCVGTSTIHDHGPTTGRFAIAIFDADVWDRGVGTEATALTLRHAFDDRGLHRVWLKVFSDNPRAIRCYEKAGFVREGLEREVHRGPGGWRDDIVMGILEQEWRASR